MFPAALYRQGLSYVQKGQVTDLLYDLNHHVWTANVQGNNMYFVEVNLTHLAKGSISAYCECPAYDTYTSCQHIVAVLISIAKKRAETLGDNIELTNRLLHTISSSYTHESTFLEKTPLHVIYELTWSDNGYLSIELKVGPKRCYVVQDLVAFLQNVIENNPHYFTKTFTYHPDSHVFLQQDREVFDLLFTILRNEKVYQDHVYPYFEAKQTKRSIIIPPLLIKEILDKLSDRDVTVEVDNQIFQDLHIVHDTL